MKTLLNDYKQLADICNYEVFYVNYLNSCGKRSREYLAFKKGTNRSEAYRIGRSSLKALRKEIES